MAGFKVAAMQVKLLQATKARTEAAAVGLELACEHILGVARERVPIEEGTLERSGAVVMDPDNLVGYVTFDTPYAVVQHEDLTFSHDEGRQAKYLETAFNSERDTARKIIADTIRGA